MRKLLPLVLSLAVPCVALAQDAAAPVSAQVKVGTAVVNHDVEGASDSFQVAPETKLYTWVKVSGAAESKITVAYLKEGKEITKVELAVPRSPFRTYSYKTFRAGDSGTWTAVARAADGTELGKADFSVQVQ
ncbi:MAG TPA: DUF2914 domain-containing protein [Anaeromyxobacter sp.]|nr:DUF2914 domain-containing protein [Anaeromyxobacter sp.]